MDPRVEKVADILVNYSTEVKEGDFVIIRGSPEAEPLMLATYKAVLAAGGYVAFDMAPTGADEVFYKYANADQLARPNAWREKYFHEADVMIVLRASHNTKALSQADPAKLAQYKAANRALTDVYMRRAAEGELRWVLTQHPTQASAQDAEMSLAEYADFIYGASMVHLDDPVAHWQGVAERQDKLVKWLAGKKQVRVTGENIDLTLSIDGRTFINASGQRNFPDGEIFTGPVEESVNGWVRFTYPAVYNSREVEGVELKFEDGKVASATAARGEDYLNSVLDTDDGARYLGEFAIGTNTGITQFTRNILFDEKIGGTVHMAVGASYPDTGGLNKSAIHWDMICDMRSGGQIHVDGELFYKDGEFVV
ncbi:MAG: aminopeptidase [Chloroflexi bacterium]|nr:aminopeptidase [Chloroflexota bacterium]